MGERLYDKSKALMRVGGVMLVLTLISPSGSLAQERRPPVDSLIAGFVQQGSITDWPPFKFFEGCPALDSWQREGIVRLMSMELSPRREDDLALSWAYPLATCADPQLEQWYFDRMSDFLRQGRTGYGYRRALQKAGTTTTVRQYLRATMLDPTIPEDGRDWAGGVLIEPLQVAELRAEWQRAFESEHPPRGALRFATRRLLNEDAQWFVPESARRIRNNPDLSGSVRLQVVLHQFIQDGSAAQRETIARAIEDAAARAPADRRDTMRADAAWVRRGKPAEAQREPPVDSLIAHFLERGSLSDWQPHLLFKGCPALEEWQERGIRRLMSEDLSRKRTDDLAAVWSFALRDCNDPRLEQWYFERLNAAIRRGDSEWMITFWTVLDRTDSPRIREYLRNNMLDVSVPMPVREVAGGTLFARLSAEERMQEYLSAFETMRLPELLASSQTDRLLQHNAERFLREIGRLVNATPELGDQAAFHAIVEFSPRYANDRARRDLGEALQAGLDRAAASISGRRRGRLESAAEFLKRPLR